MFFHCYEAGAARDRGHGTLANWMRRGLLLRCLAALFLGFLAISAVGTNAHAVDPLSGLDVRPANPTCLAGPRPGRTSGVRLETVFTHLKPYDPFYLQQSPADPATWYFSTRAGKVYAFTAPGGEPREVLDASRLVGVLNRANIYQGGSEQWGITSFALHPRFDENGYIFIAINGRQESETEATSMVVRYTLVRSGDGFGTTFNPVSLKPIISMRQTNGVAQHHWGQVLFSGGLLYIGSGDGTDNAPSSRPLIRSQDCSDLRGKILRIDVDTGRFDVPYTIPGDNPYAGSRTCRGEVFAMGMRNPWAFSADPDQSDLLWVGDAGRNLWEEVEPG